PSAPSTPHTKSTLPASTSRNNPAQIRPHPLPQLRLRRRLRRSRPQKFHSNLPSQLPPPLTCTFSPTAKSFSTPTSSPAKIAAFPLPPDFEVTASDSSAVLLELNGNVIPPLGTPGSSGKIVLSTKDVRQ